MLTYDELKVAGFLQEHLDEEVLDEGQAALGPVLLKVKHGQDDCVLGPGKKEALSYTKIFRHQNCRVISNHNKLTKNYIHQ